MTLKLELIFKILININDKSDTLINKINCSTKYTGNITCNWTEN